MFCFAYDYEEYYAKRGLYFDMRLELGSQHIATEDDLLDAITTMDEEVAKRYCQEFRDKYITAYGKASKLSADIIYNAIK
jgi:CDP-glycerol glycerophosphotransferase (TagB/SpsB family)